MTQGISYLLSTNIIPPISARNLITLDILVRLSRHDVGLYFGCSLDPASIAAVFGSGAKIAFTLPLYCTKYSVIANFYPPILTNTIFSITPPCLLHVCSMFPAYFRTGAELIRHRHRIVTRCQKLNSESLRQRKLSASSSSISPSSTQS